MEHKESIPKLAEASKDDRLKSSRPVTTPILPTSKIVKNTIFLRGLFS
ncbi:hypothetical protein JOD43_001400 [Pullulanibacillus pueri]|nr:hypothetical protein [Pullulanibacillus pueri]